MDESNLKVLQVSCGGLGNGGVQKIIMNIKKNINCKKSDIVVFTDEKRFYDDEFEKLEGRIYRINIKKRTKILRPIFKYLNLIYIYIKLIKILKDTHYDVIHCHNEYESGICLLAARKCGIKVRISHFHRDDYNLDAKIIYKLYSFIEKKLILRNSTSIICCSERTRNSFFKKTKVDNGIILYNSIDFPYFCKIEKIKTNELILTNVGEYCDNKNQKFLINIAKKLNDKKIDFKMYLIGFGDNYKKELENLILNLNVKNVCFIDGLKNKVENYLKKTDIFLFPSKKEGFGISLLEAQAMRIYCLASDSITQESNIGLVKYLSLNNEDLWIDNIVEYNKDANLNFDDSKYKYYDNKHYIDSIKKIYKGEI